MRDVETHRTARLAERLVSSALRWVFDGYGIAVAVALVLFGTRSNAQPQSGCDPLPPTLQKEVEAGWQWYRTGQVREADSSFALVLARCPKTNGAIVGAGYVALRSGKLPEAKLLFARVLAANPRDYDALAGLGMSAYRSGDLRESRRSFNASLAVIPGDSLSRWYLARLPETAEISELRPHVRPTSLRVGARAGRRVLEIPNGEGGWRPFWVKAVNVGAALPGKHPAEFPPNDSTYERWIESMAEMGANTLRVYTIHPPRFYAALRDFNVAHPDAPMRLIHGVWTELPPGRLEERYDDSAFSKAFRNEMHRVVDVLHGNAVIEPRPGHASGAYLADVSQWTVAYIIGREWEPYSVSAFVKRHPTRTVYRGRYLSVSRGNAVDVWLGQAMDSMITYEMDRYNAQRPMAYTNWPTLDPLTHSSESTSAEEERIRLRRKEGLVARSREYDNDAVTLDAMKMQASAEFPAGLFASYHAYPYYPDFMNLNPRYASARSHEGPSRYFGYLRELVEHHGEMPVIISEYGVPSSRGIAHFQSDGWHHGGHSETEQASINARLTREIHAAGAAGAGLFAIIDEWFKKNWIVADFERPAERNRLWLSALDAEQNYGVIAMRAGARDSAIVIDGKGEDWSHVANWYGADALGDALAPPLRLRSLRIKSDPAYVYLRLDVGAIDWKQAHYLIGIDTYRRDLGDTRLPYTRTLSPVGMEFVMDLNGPDGSHLLIDSPYNLNRVVRIPRSRPAAVQRVYNSPFRTLPNSDGRYDTLIVTPNRRRFGRDGTVYPSISYDRNLLRFARQTETTLADWFADSSTGTIEMRIPWGMLHVLDPSSRNVLYGDARTGEIDGVETDGFRFVVQSYDPARPSAIGGLMPRGTGGTATFAEVPLWTWAKWEEPLWHSEVKPLFAAMKKTFDAIADSVASRVPDQRGDP